MKVFYKISKFILIFSIIVAWTFNFPPTPFLKNFGGQGWPLIWQNPQIPPVIHEAQAATLSTLRPVTPDGSISNYVNESGGTTNLYASVDDDPDFPTTSDYVTNTSNTNASAFFNLTDMPSDFGSMNTLQIDFYLNAPANWNDDAGTLYAQIFQSDETITLTSELQLATHATAAGYYSVTFTTVTGSNKNTWDGARLRLRMVYNKSKGPDNGQIRVAAVELGGTYAPAAVVSVSVSDGNIAYGIMPANTSKSTLPGELNDMQVATNDGNVAENFNIKGQDASGGGCTWTLGSTSGNDQYAHQFCNDTDYDCGTPPTNYTALTTSYQALDTGIAVSGTVDFQLRLTTPTQSSCFGQQSVDVTIQAIQQ